MGRSSRQLFPSKAAARCAKATASPTTALALTTFDCPRVQPAAQRSAAWAGAKRSAVPRWAMGCAARNTAAHATAPATIHASRMKAWKWGRKLGQKAGCSSAAALAAALREALTGEVQCWGRARWSKAAPPRVLIAAPAPTAAWAAPPAGSSAKSHPAPAAGHPCAHRPHQPCPRHSSSPPPPTAGRPQTRTVLGRQQASVPQNEGFQASSDS